MFLSKDKLLNSYIFGSFFISLIAFLSLCSILVYYSFPAIIQINTNFLTDTYWSPSHNEYTILPMLYGTFTVAVLALLMAIPLGIATALFISEVVPHRYYYFFKIFTRTFSWNSVDNLWFGSDSVLFSMGKVCV